MNMSDVYNILMTNFGVAPPEIADIKYCPKPLEWYMKSHRWFRGFEILQYVPEGNDCEDFYRTQREEYQRAHRKSSDVAKGGLPVFGASVMLESGALHCVAVCITDKGEAVLLERTDRSVRKVLYVKKILSIHVL